MHAIQRGRKDALLASPDFVERFASFVNAQFNRDPGRTPTLRTGSPNTCFRTANLDRICSWALMTSMLMGKTSRPKTCRPPFARWAVAIPIRNCPYATGASEAIARSGMMSGVANPHGLISRARITDWPLSKIELLLPLWDFGAVRASCSNGN